MSWPEERERRLADFFAEMHALGQRIGVREQNYPRNHDDMASELLWIDIDEPLPIYSYYYRERNEVRILARSTDAQTVLERVFEDITQGMATAYESQHRILHEDSRRQWFRVQEELMCQLNLQWGANTVVRHDEILKHHPFMDNEI